jgi:hypothetical protein
MTTHTNVIATTKATDRVHRAGFAYFAADRALSEDDHVTNANVYVFVFRVVRAVFTAVTV